MIHWRIYYGDGSTFDHTMGAPEFIPVRTNVQHIVCRDMRPGYDPHNIGRYIVSGKYAYWYEDGEWWGGDEFGMWDYLTRPGPKVVLFGRSIANQAWHDLYQRVLKDPDFPQKSAYVAGEYNPAQLQAQDEASTY